ncbi:rod-binding protein [Pelagibacterium sp.]|uniref:rod-binding protein n=1 Tax=Pelagibacterium sp. TaxID=1967288 RepID=UPI003A8E658B
MNLNPAFTALPNSASALSNLRKQATELEGVFLNTLVSEMFKGLETDSMFGGGYAEETWRGMMSEQYAAEMAKAGGIGIADQMVAALIETQAAQTSAPQISSMGAYTK